MKNRIIITKTQLLVLENYINKFLLTESFKFSNLAKWVGRDLTNFERKIVNDIDSPTNIKFDEDMASPRYLDPNEKWLNYPLGGGKYFKSSNALNKQLTEMLDDALGNGNFSEVKGLVEDIKNGSYMQSILKNPKHNLYDMAEQYMDHLYKRVDETEKSYKKKPKEEPIKPKEDLIKPKEEPLENILDEPFNSKDVGTNRKYILDNWDKIISDYKFNNRLKRYKQVGVNEIIKLLKDKKNIKSNADLLEFVEDFIQAKAGEWNIKSKNSSWFSKDSSTILNMIFSKTSFYGLLVILGIAEIMSVIAYKNVRYRWDLIIDLFRDTTPSVIYKKFLNFIKNKSKLIISLPDGTKLETSQEDLNKNYELLKDPAFDMKVDKAGIGNVVYKITLNKFNIGDKFYENLTLYWDLMEEDLSGGDNTESYLSIESTSKTKGDPKDDDLGRTNYLKDTYIPAISYEGDVQEFLKNVQFVGPNNQGEYHLEVKSDIPNYRKVGEETNLWLKWNGKEWFSVNRGYGKPSISGFKKYLQNQFGDDYWNNEDNLIITTDTDSDGNTTFIYKTKNNKSAGSMGTDNVYYYTQTMPTGKKDVDGQEFMVNGYTTEKPVK